MSELTLGVIESKFADIIWNHEPISSTELWKKCNEELEWKKSTTFTVLRRLCEKGIFQNNNGMVTSVISRDEFYSLQSEKIVEDMFEGSLPAFIAAFTSRKALTKREVEELRRFIENYQER